MELLSLVIKFIMGFLILQWNARSLIANGQEFKRYVQQLKVKPDVICIQETWLKPHLDFNIRGYKVIRQDRDNDRGGGVCATFIKEGISYGRIIMNFVTELEVVVTEIWVNKRSIVIVNLYNPCKRMKIEDLREFDQGHKIIF